MRKSTLAEEAHARSLTRISLIRNGTLRSVSAEFAEHFVIPISWSAGNIADFKFSTAGLFHDFQASRRIAVEDRYSSRQCMSPSLRDCSLECNSYFVAKARHIEPSLVIPTRRGYFVPPSTRATRAVPLSITVNLFAAAF